MHESEFSIALKAERDKERTNRTETVKDSTSDSGRERKEEALLRHLEDIGTNLNQIQKSVKQSTVFIECKSEENFRNGK